ncbi:MAG: Uma2 family endonuclease [Nitrospiraceae bacterium]
MNIPTTKLTYQDYLLLPEDGKRYEIIEGDLYMTPAPTTRHQIIVARLSHVLMTYLESHQIGTVLTAPCDVVLSDTDIFQPDLLLVLNEGSARITEKNIQGPPDLIIEILSPGTAARDQELKRKRYEHFAVGEYWLIDPDRNTMEVLRLEEDRYVRLCLATRPSECTSPLFPNLTIDLDWLLK